MELRFDYDLNKPYLWNDKTNQRIILNSGDTLFIDNCIRRIEFNGDYIFSDNKEFVKDFTFIDCQLIN